VIAVRHQELLTKAVQALFFAALIVVVLGTVAPGSSIPSSAVWNDKLLHLVGYFGLGFLGGTGWPDRRMVLFFLMPIFGMALEVIQGVFIPWRAFDCRILSRKTDSVFGPLTLGGLALRMREFNKRPLR